MAGADDLAAALVVAIEAGWLDASRAIRVADLAIAANPDPPGWLISASLASQPQDLIHHLHEGAGDHPMLRDAWALLEAMDRALAAGADAMSLARKIERFYPYGEWPAELSQALYDVYEEATCAHMHGGVPQRSSVEEALGVLLVIVRGKSTWGPWLDRLAE